MKLNYKKDVENALQDFSDFHKFDTSIGPSAEMQKKLPLLEQNLKFLQSDDVNAQIQSLKWLCDFFCECNFLLPEGAVLFILHLTQSPIPEIHTNSIHLICLLLSFQSPMTDLIFNNNIIAIAIQNFPSSYSFGIFINLSLSSPIYREALIQAGIFQQLFSILNDPMSLYHIQAIHLSDSLLYKLEDFDYSNFIDAYISLFQILFSKINTSDALLLHQLLRFIRDFIEADQRFLLYFVNNNFYPQILSLDVTDTNCIYNIIKISDNICYYFNEGIPFLIQHNIIEYLSNTLLNSDQRIVEVSFYLLSQMIFEDNSIADLCVESSFQRIAIAKFNGESKHHLKQAAYEFLCQLMLNTTENYYVELNGDRCIYVLLSYIYLCEEENRSDMCAVIDRFLKTRAEDEIQLVMSEMEGEDDFIEWLERGAEGNDEDVAALSESLLQKLYEDPEYDDE